MAFSVSVVMPALNEEGNIQEAIANAAQAFERLGVSGEIVVVDDGSTDRTGQLVQKMQEQYGFVRLHRHEQPMGIGKSFWDGVSLSRNEIVTMLPGDAENDGYEILRYLPLLNEVDIVVPFVFNRGKRTWFRRQVSVLYRTIINKTFGTSFNYLNGTVMYRRSILNDIDLCSTGFFYQTELLIKLSRAGYLYSEVPYGLKARPDGASKAITLRSLRRVINEYLRAYWSVMATAKKTTLRSSVSHQRREEFLPSESTAPTRDSLSALS